MAAEIRTSNGTAYDLHGPADAPVIVLVHGLGLTRATWEGHVPALAKRYRIVNYDLFGHGESAPPPATPSLKLFSQQLRDLLDGLAIDRAAIVGFSLGGMINRRFAMDHPGRVSALGIFNSPHERGEDAQRLVEERAAQSHAGGPGANIEATIARWFTPHFIETRGDFTDRIRGWVLANDADIYAGCRMVLAAGVIELIRPAPPINVPSIIITCQNDSGSTPEMSLAIASEIAGAETIIIPHLQHMGLAEKPEAFTGPLLAFLGKALQP